MILYYFDYQSQNNATIENPYSIYFAKSAVNNGIINFAEGGTYHPVPIGFYENASNSGSLYIGASSVFVEFEDYAVNNGSISSPLTTTCVYFSESSVNNATVSAWASFDQATNNSVVIGNVVFLSATNNGTVSGYASLDSGSVNTGTLLSAILAEGVVNTGTVVVIVTGGGVQYTAISANNTVYYVSGANMTLDAAASASAVLYTNVGLSTPATETTINSYWMYYVNNSGVVSRANGYIDGTYYITGSATNLDSGGNSVVTNEAPPPYGVGTTIEDWNGVVYQGGSPYTGTIQSPDWTPDYDGYGNVIGYQNSGSITYHFTNGVFTHTT